MSSILDALRKSERARRLGRAPVYRDGTQPAQTALLRGLSLAAGAVLLAALAGSAWLLNRPESPVAISAPERPPTGVPPSAPESAAPPAPERSAAKPGAALAGPDGRRQGAAPAPRAAAASRSPATATEAPWLSALPDAFRAGLPALVVNIHVYAPDEGQRILYINNRPLQRGEEIEGVVVEEIVPEGVVLRARGQRFKLPRPS